MPPATMNLPNNIVETPSTTMDLVSSGINLPDTAYYLPPATMNLSATTLQTATAEYFLGVCINELATYRVKLVASSIIELN